MITKEILKQIAPSANDKIIADLEIYFNKYFDKYGINTKLRICHFLAQAAHETDGFRTLEEYASGVAYEGRRDLGNNTKGDGRKYKGRGIFQLTGRSNYITYGNKLGYDLVNNPELAKSPEVSALVALEYWNSKKLSDFADQDDVATITKRINGGFNGFDDRKAYLAKCKKIVPEVIARQESSENPVNIVMAKRGDKSNYVMDIQAMLNRKGAKLTTDGSFGPATEAAVKTFQEKNNLPISGQVDTLTLNKLMEL